jgi:hypothetical protein
MRITKIDCSGELAPIAGWAATSKHPPPSAEPSNYTADALGGGYSHLYIKSTRPPAVVTRCCVISSDSVNRSITCRMRLGHARESRRRRQDVVQPSFQTSLHFTPLQYQHQHRPHLNDSHYRIRRYLQTISQESLYKHLFCI